VTVSEVTSQQISENLTVMGNSSRKENIEYFSAAAKKSHSKCQWRQAVAQNSTILLFPVYDAS
jgi:hypothetical protein